MKVYIASDHAGYEYKGEIIKFLEEGGYEVIDCGNEKYDSNDDYPDFIIPLAEKVSKAVDSFGIALGRSGNGEAIAANKVEGVRAAMGFSPQMTKKAREDNDANILCLGADYVDLQTACKAVEIFLKTPFSGIDRHARRIKKIKDYETSKDR